MKCARCKNEQGVTVIHRIKSGKETLEAKYMAGMVTMADGKVLCYWCACPTLTLESIRQVRENRKARDENLA